MSQQTIDGESDGRAAQRGQAELARMAIEKDLDDPSASLFDQAITMVAEARRVARRR